jgi:hypothetical protein
MAASGRFLRHLTDPRKTQITEEVGAFVPLEIWEDSLAASNPRASSTTAIDRESVSAGS